MASENPSNGGNGGSDQAPRGRRSSITQAALSNLFSSGRPSGGPQTGNTNDAQRRRLSVTTLGLSGSSGNNPNAFGIRRGSMSTNSDSIDESAIDEDEAAGNARTAPTTPFVRRMSFGGSAMRGYRPGGGSPGNGNNPTSPPPNAGRRASGQVAQQGSSVSAALSAAGRRASVAMPDQQGYNWSEKLKTRAESSVSGARPSFSLGSSSPPRNGVNHDRAKSVSDMPQPPVQPAPPKPERAKPDAFQERILKGDFYMD